MDSILGLLIFGGLIGTCYGWLSARFALKETGFLELVISLGVLALSLLLIVDTFQHSTSDGIILIVIAIICAIFINMKVNSRHENQKANPPYINPKYSGYSKVIVRHSMDASQAIIKVLRLSTSKDSDRVMFEIIAYSLFITSLQLQSSKVSPRKIDETVDSLTDAVAAHISKMTDSPKGREYKLLTTTMRHFYKNHIGKSSSPEEILKGIATSVMVEYRSGNSKDFQAMTEIVNILADLGGDLNETGFAKSFR